MKVTIILGGTSSEKDVSINTGLSVAEALGNKFNVNIINLGDDLSSLPEKLFDTDIVFNALHGGIGENGVLQSFFDLHNVKYTGSGAKASKLAMDKHLTKVLAKSETIPTPNWIYVRGDNEKLHLFNDKSPKFDLPYVVKPSEEGSTMGLSIVKNKNDLRLAIQFASEFSNKIMVEEFISGRELTVGILGNKPLPIVEIIPKHDFYDYECKYSEGMSTYVVPAQLPNSLARKIQKDALKIYHALDCKNYARVDFRLNENNEHFLLEVNTLPGLTSTSLLPKAAKVAGLSFPSLIEIIINLALAD